MRFSPDTSRLVEGCIYWCAEPDGTDPEPMAWRPGVYTNALLWGDECHPPTVEVEPEPQPEPALLPCPFCGGGAFCGAEAGGSSWANCPGCGAIGPDATSPASAAVAWNTRAPAPPAPAPAEPAPPAGETLFTCRCCARGGQGWTDGSVCVPGWHTIDHIDGPNAICPICIEEADPLASLREDYPNAAIGKPRRVGLARREAEPSPPAWVPPVCPAGQVFLDDGSLGDRGAPTIARCDMHDVGYPPPSWPPRIGEIVEVLHNGHWVQGMVTSAPRTRRKEVAEFVECSMWTLGRNKEGIEWRWVYRDLSDYVPPGGSNV